MGRICKAAEDPGISGREYATEALKRRLAPEQNKHSESGRADLRSMGDSCGWLICADNSTTLARVVGVSISAPAEENK